MLPSKHGVELNLENLRKVNDAMWTYLSFPLCNIEITMFGQIFNTSEHENGQNNDEMTKSQQCTRSWFLSKGRTWAEQRKYPCAWLWCEMCEMTPPLCWSCIKAVAERLQLNKLVMGDWVGHFSKWIKNNPLISVSTWMAERKKKGTKDNVQGWCAAISWN